MAPPWTLLPIELLEIISQKIADISDFVRFRSVCKSWRSAANPQTLSPQHPWLLLPYDPTTTSRSFFTISTRSLRTLDLPETLNQNIYGSSNGWLLMLDKTLNISLLNPLTRSLIQLPRITTLPQIHLSRFVWIGDAYVLQDPLSRSQALITLEKTQFYFNCYAFVSPNTNSANLDGVVAFLVDGFPQIQYWRPGGEAWTTVDCGLLDGFIQAMAFHKGKLYAIDWSKRTAVFDLGPNGTCTVIPSLELPGYVYCNNYLVSSGEELLLAIQDYSEGSDGRSFEYFKSDENGGTMTWTQLHGVWDCMVFLTVGLSAGLGKLMHGAYNARAQRINCLCCAIAWKHKDRMGRQLSRLDVLLIGDEYRGLYGTWETLHPNLMSSSWIVPSLY